MWRGALICTGRALRLVDASRTWARRALEFTFAEALADERSATILAVLCRADTLAATARPETSLTRLVERSDAHGLAVCASLGDGVLEALTALVNALNDQRGRHGRAPSRPPASFEQALTIVYRLLFLLFAEARALVPTWHQIYRDAYSVGALCRRSVRTPDAAGLWATLQAISRLAHAGCHAGDLVVTAFNGRLFSPRHTPLGESARVADRVVGNAIVSLATRPSANGRQRGFVRGSRRRTTWRGLRTGPRLRASARTGRGRAEAHLDRAEEHGELLHAARHDRVPGASHAPSARRRAVRGRDPAAARARSGHGQRRISRRRLPLPGRCRGDRASSAIAAI